MLKNNYKDDVLDTSKNDVRKYQMIYNSDGTVSFVDVTQYSQVGDTFGAKDLNDIIECIQGIAIVNVPRSGWVPSTGTYAGKYAFDQLIMIAGMTDTTSVRLEYTYDGLLSKKDIEEYENAFNLIAGISHSESGGIRLHCLGITPNIDIKIKIIGISR